MYYIICDGQIVDTSSRPPTSEELQEWANDLDAEAYIIEGEHFGMTAYPEDDDADDESEE